MDFELFRLYLSEESVLNKELVDLLLPTIIQVPFLPAFFHLKVYFRPQTEFSTTME